MFRTRVAAAFVTAALVGGALIIVGETGTGAAEPLTVITTTQLPNALNGVPYSTTLTASGGVPPYTWELDGEQLWRWVSLSPSGVISGTPTGGGGAGVFFRVTDSTVPPNSVEDSALLVVERHLLITTASLPAGLAGAPYGPVFLSTHGGQPPIRFSRGSTLPRGIKLNSAGFLSGVPKFGGTWVVTINAADKKTRRRPSLVASRTFTLTIAGPPGRGGGGGTTKPVITGAGDVTCVGAVAMQAALAGSGSGYAAQSIFKGNLGCSGTTGNGQVQIVGAKVTGGFRHSGGCTITGVHSNSYPSQTLFAPITIAWKAKGGVLQPSSLSYSNHNASSDGLQLPASGGTSNVSGSYAGSGTATGFLLTSMVTTMQNQCGTAPVRTSIPATLIINL